MVDQLGRYKMGCFCLTSPVLTLLEKETRNEKTGWGVGVGLEVWGGGFLVIDQLGRYKMSCFCLTFPILTHFKKK